MTALVVDSVTVGFGGRMALLDVDLAACAGEVTGLIGPNGAGKTTLFNVVCGLQAPANGRVRIGGRDVTRLAPYRRARQGLARTFQRLELFGLDAVADQRADRLPTGHARVVELARALATRPTVLLLDEPASGQDEAETARFAAVLREVAAEGVAVVLVEHDIQLVMDVCQTIHVLDLGRVLATGTPSEVREDAAVLAAYLGQVS